MRVYFNTRAANARGREDRGEQQLCARGCVGAAAEERQQLRRPAARRGVGIGRLGSASWLRRLIVALTLLIECSETTGTQLPLSYLCS